jgi:hypothetical protein
VSQPLSAVIPLAEPGEELVSEEELGSVLIDVGNGHPLAVGCPHASGGNGVDG